MFLDSRWFMFGSGWKNPLGQLPSWIQCSIGCLLLLPVLLAASSSSWTAPFSSEFRVRFSAGSSWAWGDSAACDRFRFRSSFRSVSRLSSEYSGSTPLALGWASWFGRNLSWISFRTYHERLPTCLFAVSVACWWRGKRAGWSAFVLGGSPAFQLCALANRRFSLRAVSYW